MWDSGKAEKDLELGERDVTRGPLAAGSQKALKGHKRQHRVIQVK